MKLLFLIILTLNLNYSFGKYGGNDIFTSLEAMKILWARDIELVNKMETIIQNMKEVIPHMERYNCIFSTFIIKKVNDGIRKTMNVRFP